ncbi:energy transducer TonB [Pedobacter nyackensis]|uniref:TonB family C-terminal domain-containing protein n=1 Tax=Pedobacter nyackensis TaxID=475255 RepID=A0A1W2EST4_9SPHI|nr:energy transducer TonB [Pedobacter nyackensis]SMD12759.1 TonB family C-terminal domain-containing protein [Pedobacter nyackensis]
MKNSRFLFLSFLFIGFAANAQRQNLYFLKNSGQHVKLRDSADYLRIVQEPAEGSSLFIVNEHYLDGSIKSRGLSSLIDPVLYQGQYISYFKNGRKQMMGTYKMGKLIDTAMHYYPNGNLYTVIGYQTMKDGKTSKYIKSVKDSTGKDLVVDGKGICSFYDKDFTQVTESGSINNGLYDGEWIGETEMGGLKYKEQYLDGKLVAGESMDKERNVYHYTKVFVQPQFKGGMEKFYTFLKTTIRYPGECQRNGIQGKVHLKFMVMKDGSIKDIIVTKNPHHLLSVEAARVVSQSPAWEPGLERGKIVNVSYNVQVSFTLRR